MRYRISVALAPLALLAGCAAPPAPLPVPVPVPTPTPTPTPAPTPPPPPPEPVYETWMDAPRSPGDWFYVSRPPFSYAAYGASETQFDFVLRCDPGTRTVSLGRVSAQRAPQPMQLRSETATRLLTAAPRQGAIETLLAADLPAADSLLDAIAISKGRFAVEVAGERTLYLPSWPEVTRVIEDCR